jgi:hypothetical protein
MSGKKTPTKQSIVFDEQTLDLIAEKVAAIMTTNGTVKTKAVGKTVKGRLQKKAAGKTANARPKFTFKGGITEIPAEGRYRRAGYLLVFGNRQFSLKHVQKLLDNEAAIKSFMKNGKAPRGYAVDTSEARNPDDVKLVGKDDAWICTLRVAKAIPFDAFHAYAEFREQHP